VLWVKKISLKTRASVNGDYQISIRLGEKQRVQIGEIGGRKTNLASGEKSPA